MNIALCFSLSWLSYVKIELNALFKTNPAPIKVYLFSSVTEEEFQKQFDFTAPARCQIVYQQINTRQWFNQTNIDTRFSEFTLFRLLLPNLIQEDRILYLDADTLVNADIIELYNTQLGNNLIAGVRDTGAGCGSAASWENHLKSIGLPITAKETYINAGVLLLDLKKIRELKLHEAWLRMANSQHYPCHDQDIINITCRDRIMLIDKSYNVSLSTTPAGLDERRVKIAHFAGPESTKPWVNNKTMNYLIWEKWSLESDRHINTKSFSPIVVNIPKSDHRIPKVIHYCWFGGQPKPPIVQKCIKSWKQFLPDYQIIEWNENNFDINTCKYVSDAYRSKKYAFVTDYVRFFAIYKHGGIYMDSDVEVLKPFDSFLDHRAFTGHETDRILITAVMGSEPGHPWPKAIVDYYQDAQFEVVPNTKTITDLTWPLIEQSDFITGFRYLKDGLVIYPVETFCNYDHQNLRPIPTKNSYAVHLFAGTWLGRTKVGK